VRPYAWCIWQKFSKVSSLLIVLCKMTCENFSLTGEILTRQIAIRLTIQNNCRADFWEVLPVCVFWCPLMGLLWYSLYACFDLVCMRVLIWWGSYDKVGKVDILTMLRATRLTVPVCVFWCPRMGLLWYSLPPLPVCVRGREGGREREREREKKRERKRDREREREFQKGVCVCVCVCGCLNAFEWGS